MALSRLTKHGLITFDAKTKRYSQTGRQFTTGAHTPHYLIQRGHLQTLELAKDSVTEVPPQLRDLSFMTLSINPRKIPAARKKIIRFRRNLAKWLESGGDGREVYRLAIQLFPLTKVPHPVERGRA